jgi:large subunit ribosomal protein L24
MKFIKGDPIIVTAGKDKGRKGKIDRVIPKEGKVLVQGVNMYKRHMKKRDERNPGGITDFSRPLPVANVALVCPKCGQRTRIGYLVTGGEKTRICRKCEQKI